MKKETEQHVLTATLEMSGAWPAPSSCLTSTTTSNKGTTASPTIEAPIDLRSHAGAFGLVDTDGKRQPGHTE